MRGQDRVAQETQARQERQKQFDQGAENKTWLKEGEAKIFRFCEQGPDLHNFAVHPYKIRTKKGIGTRNFVCLNDKEDGTACPGCEGLDRKIRGVYNVIERDRPMLRKGQDGKAVRDGQGNFIVDGHQDAVVIWDVGSITAEAVRQLDGDWKGLMSRDFKVSRNSGSSFQPYVFTPVMNDAGDAVATPMSEADLQLVQQKHDLEEVWAPPTYQEAARLVAQSNAVQGAPQQGGGQAPQQQTSQGEQPVQEPVNPYLAGAQAPQQ